MMYDKWVEERVDMSDLFLIREVRSDGADHTVSEKEFQEQLNIQQEDQEWLGGKGN